MPTEVHTVFVIAKFMQSNVTNETKFTLLQAISCDCNAILGYMHNVMNWVVVNIVSACNVPCLHKFGFVFRLHATLKIVPCLQKFGFVFRLHATLKQDKILTSIRSWL